jgi:hypothetical protein
VKVCARWLGKDGFANWLHDVGPKPSPAHSLDRYPNNNGDYEPGNVRWATRKEQANNTRRNRVIVFKGEEKSLVQWCEATGLSRSTIRGRLKLGWKIDDILTNPVRKQRNNTVRASLTK